MLIYSITFDRAMQHVAAFCQRQKSTLSRVWTLRPIAVNLAALRSAMLSKCGIFKRGIMKNLLAGRRALVLRSLGVATVAAFTTKAIASPATQNKDRYRVVFQVSDADPKKWNLTLNNVKNVQEEFGEKNIVVEIVAFGPGIGMLKADSEIGNRVLEAVQAGVTVVACENTMRGQHLTNDDMLGKIGFVPAGVGELVRRQADGYAYIRS